MGFASCECRWFFEGEVDDDVVDWFRERRPWEQSRDLGPPKWPERARVDRYVMIPNNHEIGIKWRGEPVEGEEAQLEVKGKVVSLGVQTLAPGVTGVVERWIKWACSGEVMQASRLLDVEKRRILRKVRFDPSAADIEVPPTGAGSYVDRGLQIELTRLSLAGDRFWTLGFEGFPDSSDLREEFSQSVSLFLRELPGSLTLSSETSFSYPEWLARRQRHAKTPQ
jgi:hypothetical protein